MCAQVNITIAGDYGRSTSPDYVRNLIAQTPSTGMWLQARSVSFYAFMRTYGVKEDLVNMNAYLAQQGLPLHYSMVKMRDALMDFRYQDVYPTEPPMDLYLDPLVSMEQLVPATVSVISSVPHMCQHDYKEAKEKKQIVYFRPKLDGAYTWSIDFGAARGSVLFSYTKASVLAARTSGYSFERLSRPDQEDLYVAHGSDHISGFPTINALEDAFGAQDECIVGVLRNEMLLEFKVKDVLTFELQAKKGELFDLSGNAYGSVDTADGIYEVAVKESEDRAQKSYVLSRFRPDKSRAQPGWMIQDALNGPRYGELYNYDTERGMVEIGDIAVGSHTENRPTGLLNNRDIFDVSTCFKRQSYRSFLAYLASEHVRISGRTLECGSGLVVAPKQVYHAKIPGGVLGGFLVTYYGGHLLHPGYPQSLLQSVYSACVANPMYEMDALTLVTQFIRIADKVFYEAPVPGVPEIFKEVAPFLTRYLRPEESLLVFKNKMLGRLYRIMQQKQEVDARRESWIPVAPCRLDIYDQGGEISASSLHELIQWDNLPEKSRRSAKVIHRTMEMINRRGGRHYPGLMQGLTPLDLSRDTPKSIGPVPWVVVANSLTMVRVPLFATNALEARSRKILEEEIDAIARVAATETARSSSEEEEDW
jgi:hypothetical protein